MTKKKKKIEVIGNTRLGIYSEFLYSFLQGFGVGSWNQGGKSCSWQSGNPSSGHSGIAVSRDILSWIPLPTGTLIRFDPKIFSSILFIRIYYFSSASFGLVLGAFRSWLLRHLIEKVQRVRVKVYSSSPAFSRHYQPPTSSLSLSLHFSKKTSWSSQSNGRAMAFNPTNYCVHQSNGS